MKKLKLTTLAAAAMLTVAGTANAADIELNFFGASAQYLFWQNAANAYLTNQLGCTVDAAKTGTAGNYHVTFGGACSNLATLGLTNGDNVLLRYSSKASYAGIWALQGHADTTDNPGASAFTGGVILPATNPALACQDVANGSQPADYRWFADADSIVAGAVTKGLCRPVTIATSDVEAAAFTQGSVGKKIGPRDAGSNITRTFTGLNAVTATTPVALTNAQPLIVPFGLFVNKAVAYNKCTTTATANIGQLCYQDADCGGNAGSCAATSDGLAMNATCSNANTIDDLTREQATAIFSGAAKNWADFGRTYASQPIVACFRHAGSGTHSTMDYTLNHKSWGGTTSGSQKLPTSGVDYGTGVYATALNPSTPNLSTANVIWFNDSSGDAMKCIQGASVVGAWTGATAHTTSCIGAVGYADADQACSAIAGVSPIKYNGKFASRAAIRNGHYDYWSNQQMYWNPANTGVAAIATNMDNYVGNPANLTAANLGNNACKASYYASRDEMVFKRATLNSWPVKGTALIPVLP